MSNEDSIMLRVEHDLNGIRTICYGELSESKLERFLTGDENFIGISNNGELIVIAKDSIFTVELLESQDMRLEKKATLALLEKSSTECLES